MGVGDLHLALRHIQLDLLSVVLVVCVPSAIAAGLLGSLVRADAVAVEPEVESVDARERWHPWKVRPA